MRHGVTPEPFLQLSEFSQRICPNLSNLTGNWKYGKAESVLIMNVVSVVGREEESLLLETLLNRKR